MSKYRPSMIESWPGPARRLRAGVLALRAAARRPLHINIEATNRCQLHCVTCPVGRGLTRQAGVLERSTFVQLLDQLRWPVVRMNWLMGGEPLLHPDLFELVGLAAERAIRSKIDTNGMLLEEAVPQIFAARTYAVNVVLEATDPQRAATLRVGYDLARVLAGLSRLCGERRRRRCTWPLISVNCLVGRHNEEHLDDVIATARALGVDFINFKSINFNIASQLDARRMAALVDRHAPRAAEFRRDRQLGPGPEAHGSGSASCTYVTHDLTILYDGNVVPCCLDFEGRHLLGNVARDDLIDLWRSARFCMLRARVLGGGGLDICRACVPRAGTRKLVLS